MCTDLVMRDAVAVRVAVGWVCLVLHHGLQSLTLTSDILDCNTDHGSPDVYRLGSVLRRILVGRDSIQRICEQARVSLSHVENWNRRAKEIIVSLWLVRL
jgi:hypothetical protein